MDYELLEQLVISSKKKNEKAKNELFMEFMPYIKSLSRKTFIFGYSREDIEAECFITLLTCIEKYNIESHRFVAYAVNSLKNCVNYLIRKNLKCKNINGEDSLTFTGDLSSLNVLGDENPEDNINRLFSFNSIIYYLDNLTFNDKELMIFTSFRKNTLKSYALLKNMSYSTVSKRRYKIKNVLKKVETI